MEKRSWHSLHKETLTYGQRLADIIANGMGSWKFIIFQSLIVILWMSLNLIAFIRHWDPYPFILLNLLFSTQAAYAAPIIIMSQNRQSARDRIHAEDDYQTNIQAKEEIEALQRQLTNMEIKKLDKIIEMLQEIRKEQKR